MITSSYVLKFAFTDYMNVKEYSSTTEAYLEVSLDQSVSKTSIAIEAAELGALGLLSYIHFIRPDPNAKDAEKEEAEEEYDLSVDDLIEAEEGSEL
jgi:hypothetical protein